MSIGKRGDRRRRQKSPYRSCALASFAALNEQFKLKADNKTLRALMPFTGGIALKGETCGAVSGSLLALGFFFGPIDQKGKNQFPSSMINGGVFMDRFQKEFDSTRCWGVQKHQYGRYYDSSKPEEMKLFIEVAQKSGKCIEVVKKSCLYSRQYHFRKFLNPKLIYSLKGAFLAWHQNFLLIVQSILITTLPLE